jgi:hypothetical protein
MTEICKACSQNFEIRTEDTIFYEQVKDVPPLYCPDCRAARRLSFRNERTLYRRPCDLCKKDGISLYPVSSPYPIYCHTCWWSDDWDPKSFAQDYDPSRSFLEQFAEMRLQVPRTQLLVINSVRSEYTNNAADNKDCYLIFAGEENEDSAYSRLIMKCKSVFDCAFVYESEKCYECIDGRKLYNCMFTEQCQSSTDLYFSYNCRDSTNAIFCTNGRHISYQIENEPCTKEEFEAKRAEIFSSHESLESAKQHFEDLKRELLVKYTVQTKCHNVTGGYLFNCYDGIRLFDTADTKNASYMADATEAIDCMDCNNTYYKPKLCYDGMGFLQSNRSKHSTYIMFSNDVEYSDSCYNSQSVFGCVGIRKGNYMILNREYEKEEYEALKEKIIAGMKVRGEYGQFLPPELSPFGYNETLAKEYYPLIRDEALSRGYRWQDETTGTHGKGTLLSKDIPATADADESILKEVLECEVCKKNYRLTKAELGFYKQVGVPIPRQDFECRHQARMAKRTPRKLWSRACMCEMTSHDHEGVCPNKFETPYSPERKEILYCEDCFNREVA